MDKLAGDKMSAECQLTVRDKAAHYRVHTPTKEALFEGSLSSKETVLVIYALKHDVSLKVHPIPFLTNSDVCATTWI